MSGCDCGFRYGGGFAFKVFLFILLVAAAMPRVMEHTAEYKKPTLIGRFFYDI